MFWVILWMLIVFLILLYLYHNVLSNRFPNLPPGPIPLPIIGNIHQVGANPYLGFYNLFLKYGILCTLNLGNTYRRTILISGDPKILKDAFNNIAFAGKSPSDAEQLIVGDQNGIVFGQGEEWTEKRRFTLRQLSQFGFGKQSVEELIMEDVNDILEWARKHNGKPIENLRLRLSLAVVNSLWKMASGERYDHDDKKLNEIMEELEQTVNEITKGTIGSAVIFFYPKVAKYFANLSGWNKLSIMSKNKRNMICKKITQHKSTLHENPMPRDFTDAYLMEIQKTSNPTSSFHSTRNPEQSLLSILSDLFAAGSHTISISIAWSILCMLHFPEVQQKVYEEIQFIVGNARAPSLTDRSSLPYCEATILEVIRFRSVTYITPTHSTTEDIPDFHGYFIPKGTTVIGNIYSMHHNPKVWKDPENFRPERFLTPDCKGIDKSVSENIVAFSTGKRACIGESLARNSMFLFLTSIIQNFELKVDSSKPFPGIIPASGGISLNPVSYSVIFKERAS